MGELGGALEDRTEYPGERTVYPAIGGRAAGAPLGNALSSSLPVREVTWRASGGLSRESYAALGRLCSLARARIDPHTCGLDASGMFSEGWDLMPLPGLVRPISTRAVAYLGRGSFRRGSRDVLPYARTATGEPVDPLSRHPPTYDGYGARWARHVRRGEYVVG